MFGVLAVSWFLTVGVVPVQYERVEKAQTIEITSRNVSTVAEIGLSAMAFDRLEIYGSVETFQFKSMDSAYFIPYRADYTFGARFRLIDGVTLGVNHYCNHPVDGPLIKNTYQGGETQFTLTFSGGGK